MKLLFDENLSHRLVGLLTADFPDSEHITRVGLMSASDQDVWKHARDHGYVLVSKDDDFRSLSLVHGSPPKVILLRVGNSSTDMIAALLHKYAAAIRDFAEASSETLLILRQSD